MQEFKKLEGRLINLAISKKSQFVLIVSSKPCVFRLNLANFAVEAEETELPAQMTSISLSNSEVFVAFSDDNNRIFVYDTDIMEKRYVLKGHLKPVSELCFLLDEHLILSASLDCTLAK